MLFLLTSPPHHEILIIQICLYMCMCVCICALHIKEGQGFLTLTTQGLDWTSYCQPDFFLPPRPSVFKSGTSSALPQADRSPLWFPCVRAALHVSPISILPLVLHFQSNCRNLPSRSPPSVLCSLFLPFFFFF